MQITDDCVRVTVCVRVCVAGCVCVAMLHIKFAVFWFVWCFEAACDASSAAFRPLLKSMQHFQIKFWAFYAIMHAIAVECGDCCLPVLQVQRAANECRCGCGCGCGTRLCIALSFDFICGHPNLQLPFLFFSVLSFFLFFCWMTINATSTKLWHNGIHIHTHTHALAFAAAGVAATVKLAHNMEKSFGSFAHQHQRACWAHVKHSNAIC